MGDGGQAVRISFFQPLKMQFLIHICWYLAYLYPKQFFCLFVFKYI